MSAVVFFLFDIRELITMNERLCETTIHFNAGNGTYFFSTRTVTFPKAKL